MALATAQTLGKLDPAVAQGTGVPRSKTGNQSSGSSPEIPSSRSAESQLAPGSHRITRQRPESRSRGEPRLILRRIDLFHPSGHFEDDALTNVGDAVGAALEV